METVRSFRYSEYLNRRTHYFSIVEYQKCGVFKTSQSSTTGGRSTDASGGEGWFSALDDPEFYNEMPSPDVQTITEFFNSYIEERDNELQKKTQEKYYRLIVSKLSRSSVRPVSQSVS